MRNGVKIFRIAALLACLFALAVAMPNSSSGRIAGENPVPCPTDSPALLPDAVPASQPEPIFTDGPGGGSTPDPDIVAVGWDDVPLTPPWTREDRQNSPYDRREGQDLEYAKGVPAPDGGLYLFLNAIETSPKTPICVEHYDRNLNFITSPDLGLHIVGHSPYGERHNDSTFDVKRSGENYYLTFVCWDKNDSVLLVKYDKNLKPLYGPMFIDYGYNPAIVEANGKIYIVYTKKYYQNEKRKFGLFKMTIVEQTRKIDGKDCLMVHLIHNEMLPIEDTPGMLYAVFPSVAYDGQRKEFCLIYNALVQQDVFGDPVVQLFDENWRKKGAAVNLHDYTAELRRLERHDSILPNVVVHKGQYIFAINGPFKIHATGNPRQADSVALIKCNSSIQKTSMRPLYVRRALVSGKITADGLNNSHLFEYDGGLAVVGALGYGSALFKLDSNLIVKSAHVLNGGIPKKPDLFASPDHILAYPPRGVLGCEQSFRIPINNRGLQSPSGGFNVEMYFQNQKVSSTKVAKVPSFNTSVNAEIAWTVPENLAQQEIEVQFKIDPENKLLDSFPANNVFTLKLKVWDKGMVRGFVCDGSLGIIDWLPLAGAKVTLSAPGFGGTVTTDKTGYYEFDRVPFGNYHLKVEKANYNPLEENRTLIKRIPCVTLRNQLDNHGTFEVEVNPDKAARACSVMLYGGVFEGIDAEKVATGKYGADVPAGKYHVKITAPGFLPYNNTDVTVNLGQKTSITVTLEEATFSIVNGYVCDYYGDPIPNAGVTFSQKSWADNDPNCPKYTVNSGEDGRFSVELTGYEQKVVRFQNEKGEWQTMIERGDPVKGTAVSWRVHSTAPNVPAYNGEFSARTGYEEYCEICLCDPEDGTPTKTGVIEAYVPWTYHADFPGFINYPELNAYTWYGLFAAGITADYNSKKDNVYAVYVGVQGLAYEMHAVSGKFPISDRTSVPKSTGWTRWASLGGRIAGRLWKLKNTLADEPDDSNEVPTVFETLCDTIMDHLGPSLFIPGVDAHKTSVRVDLVQVISTGGDDKDTVLFSDNQQFFSHSSPDDDAPNVHLKRYAMPQGINRKQIKVVVYLKIQKLLLDDRTPDGLVPFYLNQYIRLEWKGASNDMKAYYEAEYNYLRITGLSFE